MTFQELVYNKRVVYVPIYSMFDHSTKKINLTCDGNVNRWMTNFFKANYKSLEVYVPERSICKNFDLFLEKLSKFPLGVKFYESKAIRKSAGFQRSGEFADEFLKDLKLTDSNDQLLVIVEGQGLAKKLVSMSGFGGKIVFWCPVCQTNHKKRDFMKPEAKALNEMLFDKTDFTILAAQDQYSYLKELKIGDEKIIMAREFIDRELSIFSEYTTDEEILSTMSGDLTTVYLPFRLSDEGYRIWDIFEVLERNPEVRIYSPNVNGADDEELLELCKKNGLEESITKRVLNRLNPISSERDSYYTAIDCCKNIVIPYFEDIDFIMHAAVDELLRGKKKPVCRVVTTKEDFEKELAIRG